MTHGSRFCHAKRQKNSIKSMPENARVQGGIPLGAAAKTRLVAAKRAVDYAVRQAELGYSFCPNSYTYHMRKNVKRAASLLDEVVAPILGNDE